MKTTVDRIKSAVAFEIIGLILILGIICLCGFDVSHIGVLGIAFSLMTTGWNYIYNIWFDKVMLKWVGTTNKQQKHRILHAILFELGLLWITIPVMAWWLNIKYWQAFLMDIVLVVFYLFYAYFYNVAYDKLFPVDFKHETKHETKQ
ncbi:PACE efflux transporter [Candidatus Enterovibrio escicola]|nr:PACE efflux transporter [Candidatus Enterovibrio escacola]